MPHIGKIILELLVQNPHKASQQIHMPRAYSCVITRGHFCSSSRSQERHPRPPFLKVKSLPEEAKSKTRQIHDTHVQCTHGQTNDADVVWRRSETMRYNVTCEWYPWRVQMNKVHHKKGFGEQKKYCMRLSQGFVHLMKVVALSFNFLLLLCVGIPWRLQILRGSFSAFKISCAS